MLSTNEWSCRFATPTKHEVGGGGRMAGKSSDMWARAVFYATLGSMIPASAVAGYFIGRFLDHHLATGVVLSVLGIFAGTAVGIVEVIQLISRTERNATRNDSSGGD